MAKTGAQNRVNTPDQLRQRIACNLSASEDFDLFVTRLLEPTGSDVVLDIGPGVGKQMVVLASMVGRITGLDCSPEMAAAVRAQVSGPNIDVIVGDMDDLEGLDLGGPFTLVYAVYSLYYASDPARVVRMVARLLERSRGRFVVVAPDLGNNADWFSDLGRLYALSPAVLEVPRMCREVILPAFLDTFETVTCSILRSKVSFPTVESLMCYYDACAPYCRPDRREQAFAYFRERVERDGGYWILKRSLGLVGRP
jgi:SAM-dependent methyltransferase